MLSASGSALWHVCGRRACWLHCATPALGASLRDGSRHVAARPSTSALAVRRTSLDSQYAFYDALHADIAAPHAVSPASSRRSALDAVVARPGQRVCAACPAQPVPSSRRGQIEQEEQHSTGSRSCPSRASLPSFLPMPSPTLASALTRRRPLPPPRPAPLPPRPAPAPRAHGRRSPPPSRPPWRW